MRQSAITCKAPAAVRRTRQREVRGSLRRAAALVGDHPRGRGRPVGGGNGAFIAAGHPAGERPAGHGLSDLRPVYDGAVHRQHPLPLCQHVGGRAAGPAEVRPLLDLSAHRRELYAGVHGGPAAVQRPALLAAVWAVGVVGMVLTVAKLEIPRWLTSAIYLLMGWLAIFAIVPLYRALPGGGLCMAAGRRLLYTVGGVLYAVKWPGRNNPDSAATRSFMCLSCWARCATSYSCTK